ncbi:hypothetical protein F5Y04DRAFT_277076 [Hypomontagnella monticulosa]|nr:hypothetical protein F5Y04DRAFT_277076 [Hypomontagnella monticulosa]
MVLDKSERKLMDRIDIFGSEPSPAATSRELCLSRMTNTPERKHGVQSSSSSSPNRTARTTTNVSICLLHKVYGAPLRAADINFTALYGDIQGCPPSKPAREKGGCALGAGHQGHPGACPPLFQHAGGKRVQYLLNRMNPDEMTAACLKDIVSSHRYLISTSVYKDIPVLAFSELVIPPSIVSLAPPQSASYPQPMGFGSVSNAVCV